jgi:ABC-type branched-subunit amino acid transport system substrate-binding protein
MGGIEDRIGVRRGHCARATAIAAALVLATWASACGARWSDDQRAEVAGRYRGGPSTGTDVAEDGVGSAGGDGGSTGTTTPGSQVAAGPTAGGGGGAQPTATGAGGPQPCAAKSTEKGVTDEQITIGEISSLSGPVPGLGASAAAAVRSYVAFRNATGGVCGRQIVLKEADDGTDSARYRSALRQLNPNVLGIAGGFGIGDIGAEDVINELKIPIINSPTGRTGELRWVFDINPDFPRPDMVIGKYKHLYEQGARKVSQTYTAVAQSRIEANIQRGLMEAAGLEVVHVNELPLSTLSYDAAARAAANSGADYLWFIAETSGQAAMAKSVQSTGYQWKFKEFSYTTYGTKFIELAGSAAEGATSWIRSLPTEEASTNKAMSTYVEWMDRVASGLPQDLFSIDSWVSAHAFFEALEALPGPITREAIVQQLASLQSFDADGMFAPIALGQDLSKGCFLGMIVRNGKWQRLAPAKGYLC